MDRTSSSQVQVALLDREGVIEFVNRAWEEFARDNGGNPARTGVGMSYLAVCAAAGDDEGARAAAAAIQAAVRGDHAVPVVLRLPCDSPDLPRLFDMLVSGRLDDSAHSVGATVAFSPREPEGPAGPASAAAGPVTLAVAADPHHDDGERRRRWQAASVDAVQRLFTGAAQSPLAQVLPCALEASAGQLAALALVDDGVLQVTSTSGPLADVAKALCDELVPSPLLLAGESVLVDVPLAPDAPGDPGARVGTLMASPLRVDGEVIAVIVVGRSSAAPRLDSADLKQFRGFARNLGIAVELDRARTGLETLRLFEERDRIAADLHDHVIQELFAVGMGLQGMLHGLPADQQDRVAAYVDEIDSAIAGIRGTIFGLHHADRASAGLEERLLSVLDEGKQTLGFPVPIEFFGPLDSGLPAQLCDDVVEVVREALADVARRGGASGAHVLVTIAEGVLTVDVIDDGHGSTSTSWSGGSRSLRRRAERHGGTLRLSVSPGGGTHLHWSACVPT